MLNHYFAHLGGLKSMKKRLVQHQVLDSNPILEAMSKELVCVIDSHASLDIKKIMKKYVLSEREPKTTLRVEVVIHLGNLASARETEINSSAIKVDNSWFHKQQLSTHIQALPELPL
ncbi:hypothetical protein RDI58_008158 [Solanum bulbocastanum]|uniref:Uncharacterized protein n=1 Tax=Solanum bulbocastanum TaxID=147425 RepID=A0AAN8TVA0_SOLBU